MRVLVVEDEARLSKQIVTALGGAGYAVDRAGDGARADFLVRTEQYDAVILDLGLPRIDGLSLLRDWRAASLSVPVLVLTARGSWHEKVQGIDSGADDYVAKPFRMEEVLARGRALIRRASGRFTPELRLVGALLWTVGLFIVAFVIITVIMLENPTTPRILHGTAHAYAVSLLVVATVCMAAGFSQVRKGISPINLLRERLTAVHQGQLRRVEGSYPSEVQPLVDDLNSLLAHHEQIVHRAIAKAGDLAHGLKTPLAVLAHEADQAEAQGHPEPATVLSEQIVRMQRQVEYHLVHARAAASGQTPGARCSVRESAEALARTLERLYAARGITIQVDVPPHHFVRGQREDLDEMLGNLLDNACKWTKSQVAIRSAELNGRISITVDDGGAGLEPAMRQSMLQRGVRADEQVPGSGLGLSIVRDLADIYRGAISLEQAPIGGVRAVLELPAAE